MKRGEDGLVIGHGHRKYDPPEHRIEQHFVFTLAESFVRPLRRAGIRVTQVCNQNVSRENVLEVAVDLLLQPDTASVAVVVCRWMELIGNRRILVAFQHPPADRHGHIQRFRKMGEFIFRLRQTEERKIEAEWMKTEMPVVRQWRLR